jgi:hypothetical protein
LINLRIIKEKIFGQNIRDLEVLYSQSQLHTLQGRRGPDGLSSSFGEVIVVTLGLVTFGPVTFALVTSGLVTFGPVTFGLVTCGPVTSVLASLTASPPIARSGLQNRATVTYLRGGKRGRWGRW